MSENEFFEWCILELMGHRRLFGLVCEQEIGGAKMLRIDCYGRPELPTMGDDGEVEPPPPDKPFLTQYYSGNAVYCITPTTEEICRRMAAKNKPEPIARWELPEAAEDPAQPRLPWGHADEGDD